MNYKIDSIIEAVAKEYKITKDILISKKNDTYVSEARNIAIYLCRYRTNYSAQEIGKCFGNRDHTTIHYAEYTVRQKISADPVFEAKVRQIERKIDMNNTNNRLLLLIEID